ncbi:MAG: hypothetical protein HQM13_23405 [SAR324 cluster bacterium]|nr:hypothetical protein [SAR324 cluster bacterium]
MKKRNQASALSHREIEQAVNYFLSKGGKIKLLPAQKAMTVSMIGAGKWEAYEPLRELSF